MNKWLPQLKLDLADWLLILCFSFPAFYMLGTPAIYIWDEAVYANASLDMATGGSWWVPLHGEYNTKPPLVLWLQALFLKIIPSPEWAVRLPSAFAVTGILMLMTAGLRRWGIDRLTRVLVMLCFVAHEGFIRHHISRTGDLDAVMVFFVVLYAIVFLDARVQQRWTLKHNLFFFLGVLFAFYAKSIAGWIMLGPIGVLWLLSPLRTTLVRGRFWLWPGLIVSLCLVYYLSRAWLQPGFLDLVWSSEYSRAVKNIMPWHEHEFNYYFRNFIDLKLFYPWIWLLIASLGLSLFLIKDRITKFHITGWTIVSLGYLLLVSIPPTKLEWYDAPVYPFFAMIIGMALGYGINKLPVYIHWLIIVPILFVMARKINFIQNDIAPRHPFEYEGSMLRPSAPSSARKIFMQVEMPEHRLQLDFYQRMKALKHDVATPVVDHVSQLAPGDTVMISQDKAIQEILSQFDMDTLKIWPGLGYEVLVKAQIIKE